MIPSSDQGSQRIEGVIVLASSLHLSPHQRTPSPPPLSSSCTSHRSAKLKTSNPCNHRIQQYSIIGLTNAAGTIVERYSYTAYGTLGIYDPSGTVRTTSTYANRYTYTGREYDPDLNLYHFRARWYDPSTGGFISRDPLGYVDGMSLYRGYFAVNGKDPQGNKVVASGGGRRISKRTDGSCYQYNWPLNGEYHEIDVPCPVEQNLLISDMTSTTATRVLENIGSRGYKCYNIHETYRCDANSTVNFFDEIAMYNGCRCVKELTIHGHGDCDVSARMGVDKWLTGLDTIFFCRPCTIWLNSCQSGVGDNSIAAKLQIATGCTVMGLKGFSTGFRDNTHIWFANPKDNTKIPPDISGKDVWREFEPQTCYEIPPEPEYVPKHLGRPSTRSCN